MTKKSQKQPVAKADRHQLEAARRKYGPEKRKIQVSVRIDKNLADLAYKIAEHKGLKITDFIERGIALAVLELDGMSPEVLEAQIMLGQANAQQHRLIKRSLNIAAMGSSQVLEEWLRQIREMWFDLGGLLEKNMPAHLPPAEPDRAPVKPD